MKGMCVCVCERERERERENRKRNRKWKREIERAAGTIFNFKTGYCIKAHSWV